MKLIIIRDQAKGFLGGVKFELRAQVQLTTEEAELVNRYKAGTEVLTVRESGLLERLGPFGKAEKPLTIQDMVSGQTFKCKDIAEILAWEETVKGVCGAFRTYLEVMKNFGGQEVIEY